MDATVKRSCVVLLPTYNERDNIEKIVRAILEAASVDVWILDDNSPDKTGDLAEALAQKDKRVRVTHRPNKEGLGKAYLDGFRRALDVGYERIVQMDADFSHSPVYLPEMLRACDFYDGVLGSRWAPGGGSTHWPWYRQMLSLGGSWYARTLLNMHVRDVTGGFKCWSRYVLAALDLDAVQSTGYAFQIEMTYRALQAGFAVRELPIVFVERTAGISKMNKKIVLEALWRVAQLRRSHP
ncbi:MAG: polyprenol monophosphomannose synthase [Myxococcota bacterium]